MLDIDLFKQVNDQYGHETGDEAIKWIAQHINELFLSLELLLGLAEKSLLFFLINRT